MSERKTAMGAPGPTGSKQQANAIVHELQSTIYDFFDHTLFTYCWWRDGVIERKSRAILIGRMVKTKQHDEETDREVDIDDEDEITRMFHAMLHRLPEYCNSHTVLLLSDKAEERLCKPCQDRRLPRLFIRNESTQEWNLPTESQLTKMIHTAFSDELKTYPLLSHSNWIIE